MRPRTGVGLGEAMLASATSSFTEFASGLDHPLLPASPASSAGLAPHGTTIVAATYTGGVVMAGDRRATMGNLIAQRDIEKVFGADDYSVVGIAGTAGLAIELVRLFQVELQHYEKIEGNPLSLDGKANRLASMLRANLGLAMQGLGVLPLFAGFDQGRRLGRIFSYDATGGKYEETAFHAVGSGQMFARGSLKKLYRPEPGRAGRGDRCRPGAVRRGRRRLGDRWARPGPRDLPHGAVGVPGRGAALLRPGTGRHRCPGDRRPDGAPRRTGS